MADTPRKSKYQRDIERARERGFSSPYAERKARAQAAGYSSPRTQRTASERARGVSRDYALERERANIRANARGFRNTAEQRRFAREAATSPGLDREKWQKRRTLEYFGISEYAFNKIRKENREWHQAYAEKQWTRINTYDIDLDRAVHDWSERRVGYILAFHAAIVNPKSNYDSLLHKGRNRQYEKENGRWITKTNKSQFYYLVKYTGIMQIDEFEARYGRNIVKEAEKGKVKP